MPVLTIPQGGDGSTFACDHRTGDEKLRHALMAIPCPSGNTAMQEARARVCRIESDAHAALSESEYGQKLATLRQRFATASAALDQATAEHSTAEAKHFDSLSSGTESEVEASRNVVLALHSKLEMMKRETETLNKLVSAAATELERQSLPILEQTRLDAQQEARAQFDEAYTYVLSIYETPKFQNALKTMAKASAVDGVCGRNLKWFQHNLPIFMSSDQFQQ